MSDTFDAACRRTLEQALAEPDAMLVVAAAFPGEGGGFIQTRRGENPRYLYWAAQRLLEEALDEYQAWTTDPDPAVAAHAQTRADIIEAALEMLPDPTMDDDDDDHRRHSDP